MKRMFFLSGGDGGLTRLNKTVTLRKGETVRDSHTVYLNGPNVKDKLTSLDVQVTLTLLLVHTVAIPLFTAIVAGIPPVAVAFAVGLLLSYLWLLSVFADIPLVAAVSAAAAIPLDTAVVAVHTIMLSSPVRRCTTPCGRTAAAPGFAGASCDPCWASSRRWPRTPSPYRRTAARTTSASPTSRWRHRSKHL